MKARWLGIGLVFLVALGFGLVKLIGASQPAILHGSLMNPPFAAPNFQLIDQNNQPFELAGQRGHAVLLYFGYTHCPDECPRAMATFQQVSQALGGQSSNVRFVFVSVDPARDTPAVMGKFLDQFSPAIIGLTGTQAQLQPVWQAYGIYQDSSTSQISHTDQIFLIDPQGQLRTIYPNNASPNLLLEDLKAVMKGG